MDFLSAMVNFQNLFYTTRCSFVRGSIDVVERSEYRILTRVVAYQFEVVELGRLRCYSKTRARLDPSLSTKVNRGFRNSAQMRVCGQLSAETGRPSCTQLRETFRRSLVPKPAKLMVGRTFHKFVEFFGSCELFWPVPQAFMPELWKRGRSVTWRSSFALVGKALLSPSIITS